MKNVNRNETLTGGLVEGSRLVVVSPLDGHRIEGTVSVPVVPEDDVEVRQLTLVGQEDVDGLVGHLHGARGELRSNGVVVPVDVRVLVRGDVPVPGTVLNVGRVRVALRQAV